LHDHPTVKPTVMLEDALLDLTNRGEIVLDPFLDSARCRWIKSLVGIGGWARHAVSPFEYRDVFS
jgi:hypothetical protein